MSFTVKSTGFFTVQKFCVASHSGQIGLTTEEGIFHYIQDNGYGVPVFSVVTVPICCQAT